MAREDSVGRVELTKYLLEVHERSNELGYRELQRDVLERLMRLIPFDSAVFGLSAVDVRAKTAHDLTLLHQPSEFVDSWNRVLHEDGVANWAMSHPAQTHAFAVDGPIYGGSPNAVAHCRQWGIAHLMCTATEDDAGLLSVMALHRADPARPFSEAERAANELLMPHLVSAARRALLGQLRARSRVTDTHVEAAALANHDGMVLEATPGLPEVLRAEWPGWKGPVLPLPLARLAQRPTSRRLVHGRLAFRADPADGVVLVHVRLAAPADRLTMRERQIAEAFSLGESYLELAANVMLAPNTVRRHLSNIYEKLGISSKAELQRMLRDE